MKKSALIAGIAMVLFYSGCGGKTEKETHTVVIEGIKHIINPELPLNGTVELELEKQLEINPYEYEKIGIRGVGFATAKGENIVLYDRVEAHIFNREGNYLGPLYRSGQGPGEIPAGDLMTVFYYNRQIWAKGARKIVRFNRDGEFIDEITKVDFVAEFITPNYYLSQRYSGEGEARIKHIILKEITARNEIIEKAELIKGAKMGLIRGPDGRGYGEQWGTPDIDFAADRGSGRIYTAFKSEYKINLFDSEGDRLFIVEKPHQRVRVSRREKEEILDWLLDRRNQGWELNAFPDELLSFKEIKVLPGGCLAVYRISGVKQFEVDIFDNEGRYIYAIAPTFNPLLDRAIFYDFGFGTVEEKEDMQVYVEYRIKNLPEIFAN